VAIFDRIRRARATDAATTAAPDPVPAHLLPDVNQRVTVTVGSGESVPSRVEDVGSQTLQLARPELDLEFGMSVVVSWAHDDTWHTMETRVLGVDPHANVPMILVSTAGKLTRYDDRRRSSRRAVQLPIELRVLRARGIRAGRELNTTAVEIGPDALRFESSAPFAPGDIVEARIRVGGGSSDFVGARLRIIRVDTVAGSWRTTCSAAFDEILRSDRARLVAIADATGIDLDELNPPPAGAAPTLDGIGGRDEPEPLGDLPGVIDWLRRRGQ
jgi:hypothetical protein